MLLSYWFDTVLTLSLLPGGSVAGSHAMYILATNVVLSTYIAGVQDKFRNKKISKFVTSSKITCGKRDRSNHEGIETESSKDYTFWVRLRRLVIFNSENDALAITFY